MKKSIAQGTQVPDELVSALIDSTPLLAQPDRLRARLAQDGYVLLRGVVDSEVVLTARAEVFGRLADVGEIQSPAVEGIATGTSRRRELVADLGEFWRASSSVQRFVKQPTGHA